MSEASTRGSRELNYRVVTFYSYKGGVGRSMALANVAALLAQRGRNVLAIDFDLEAPGLVRYFEQPGSKVQPSQAGGLVEMFDACRNGKPIDWRRCLSRVVFKSPGASLDLLQAGGGGPDYVRLAQSLNWDRLFEDHGLGEYLATLREEWRSEYDVVLIDSRTGVSDIGGICTIILPDALVMLFTANNQSIEGTAEIVRRARAAQELLPVERGRLLAVPMLSRDDRRTEYRQSERWRKRIAEAMADFFADWVLKGVSAHVVLQKLYLPQVAFWSFGERLPVLESPDEMTDPASLGAAYDRLANLIDSDLNWHAVEGDIESTLAVATSRVDELSAKYLVAVRARWAIFLVSVVLLSAALAFYLFAPAAIPGKASTEDLQKAVASTTTTPEEKIDALRRLAEAGQIPRGARLQGLNLNGIRLLGCEDCDLANSDLSGMNFGAGQFRRTSFANSNLARTSFAGASLLEVNFSAADLRQADFSSATFDAVSMLGAIADFKLTSGQLRGVVARPLIIDSELVSQGLLSPPPTTISDFHLLSQGADTGWDVDVFWCTDDRQAANRAVARSAALVLALSAARGEPLAPGVTLGRIRLFAGKRNDAGSLATGDFIGFEQSNGEQAAATAIAALLNGELPAKFSPAPSPGPSTRFYLSVYACQPTRPARSAQEAESELDSNSQVEATDPAANASMTAN